MKTALLIKTSNEIFKKKKNSLQNCNEFYLQYLCALVHHNLKMEEEEGFEPPRGMTRLSVFKTDPFSRTWVFLRINKI
jgi:hypothetical protein